MLLCALLVALPAALLVLALAAGSLLPLDLDLVEAPVVAPVVEAASVPVLRVAVARVAVRQPLPPVGDEMPILRARRGADGRYTRPVYHYEARSVWPAVLPE